MRKVAISFGLGSLIFVVTMLVGFLFGFIGITGVASALVWPFLALKPLIPCLPQGSPTCEGDAFASGTYLWSIALGIGAYTGLSYLLLTIARRRPLTIAGADTRRRLR
jgi:hypothetical protein